VLDTAQHERPLGGLALLEANGISQADLARGCEKTRGYLSLRINGKAGASLETIDEILTWLSARLGRKVYYEEFFAPAEAGQPEGQASAQDPAISGEAA
jgi:transcriptional regulator with XRE-family HTH domain